MVGFPRSTSLRVEIQIGFHSIADLQGSAMEGEIAWAKREIAESGLVRVIAGFTIPIAVSLCFGR